MSDFEEERVQQYYAIERAKTYRKEILNVVYRYYGLEDWNPTSITYIAALQLIDWDNLLTFNEFTKQQIQDLRREYDIEMLEYQLASLRGENR